MRMNLANYQMLNTCPPMITYFYRFDVYSITKDERSRNYSNHKAVRIEFPDLQSMPIGKTGHGL